ncbi:hypothetical protein COCON_G00199110 [Conger conger]|uniref:Myosin motor domain-containing protein n=1 Tax=Conger conger TaxID=82655 RepID=A0A9Q1D245_CONCO|nr:hypothetical protein COCON_G00199110 [Conger conger]
MEKTPNRLDPDVVLNQLRYSGMLETVKIRRAGFPVRRTFQDFFSRYKMFLRVRNATGDERGKCSELLSQYDSTKTETKSKSGTNLGPKSRVTLRRVTQVFLKEALEQRLEKEREEVRRKAGMVIRAHILSYVARKHYKRVLASTVTIQKNYRAYFWRKAFLRLRFAVLVLQKHRRGQLARSLYRHLRQERRRREEEEEERRRAEEEEEERLRLQEREELRKREEEEAELLRVRQEEAELLRVRREEAELKRRLEAEELKARQEVEAQRPEEGRESGNTVGTDLPAPQAAVCVACGPGPCGPGPCGLGPCGSVEEARQMEEILRLEREIERLQQQREEGVSLLCGSSRSELQQRRSEEILRLEREASRMAEAFVELLDFGGLEQDNPQDPSDTSAPLAEEEEEEEDEGFHAEEEAALPLPDFPRAPPPPGHLRRPASSSPARLRGWGVHLFAQTPPVASSPAPPPLLPPLLPPPRVSGCGRRSGRSPRSGPER